MDDAKEILEKAAKDMLLKKTQPSPPVPVQPSLVLKPQRDKRPMEGMADCILFLEVYRTELKPQS